MTASRVYLTPGMFGFARLAAYDYFGHVVRGIERRFTSHGKSVEVRVCEVHPTSSVRRRASKLVDLVHATSGASGPIHLVGHSTGGLDARLVASPSVHFGRVVGRELLWLDRLSSITSVNTPHYGTPLATFFATAKGQQLLYAVTALTVSALKFGAPPLSLASALVAALGAGTCSASRWPSSTRWPSRLLGHSTMPRVGPFGTGCGKCAMTKEASCS